MSLILEAHNSGILYHLADDFCIRGKNKNQEKTDHTKEKNMIEFISIAEAAQHFSVPAPTIYSYTKRGVIPSEKIFGRVLIKKSDLPEIEALLATRKKFSVQKKGEK